MKTLYYLFSFLMILQIPLLGNSFFWKANSHLVFWQALQPNQFPKALKDIDQPITSYDLDYIVLDQDFLLFANKNTKTSTKWWLFDKNNQTFKLQPNFEILNLQFSDYVGKSNFEEKTYLVFKIDNNFYSYYDVKTHDFIKFNELLMTQNNISPNYHYELWTSTNRNKGLLTSQYFFRANFSFIEGSYEDVYKNDGAQILNWINLIDENKKPHFTIVNKSSKHSFIDGGPFFELVYQDTYGALIQYNQENFSFPDDHLHQYYFSFRHEHNNLSKTMRSDINSNLNYFTFEKILQSKISTNNTFSINDKWVATNLESKNDAPDTLISYRLVNHLIKTNDAITFDKIFGYNNNFLLYSFNHQLYLLDLNSTKTINLHFEIANSASVLATPQSGFFLKQNNNLYYINPSSLPYPILIMKTDWEPKFFSSKLLILEDDHKLYPLDWSFLKTNTNEPFFYLPFDNQYYWSTNSDFILMIDKNNSPFLNNVLNISNVKVNGSIISSLNDNQTWKINLLYFLDKINPTPIEIEISCSLLGNETTIAFAFLILKDYLPKMEIRDVINNRILSSKVYIDAEQNLYDGYVAKNNTLITFQEFFLIDALFINDKQHEDNTLLIQPNQINHLKIIDIFGQTWQYRPVFSKTQAGFEDFWTSELGQNLKPKALEDGYSEEQLEKLNAHQIIHLIERISGLLYINDLMVDTEVLLSELIMLNHNRYFLSGLSNLNTLVNGKNLYLVLNELVSKNLTKHFGLETNLEAGIDFKTSFYTNDLLINDFNQPFKQNLRIKVTSLNGGRLLGTTSFVLLDQNSLMFIDLQHLTKKHFYYNDTTGIIELSSSGVEYLKANLDAIIMDTPSEAKAFNNWKLFNEQLSVKMKFLLYEWLVDFYFPIIDEKTPHLVDFPIVENDLTSYIDFEVKLIKQFGVYNTEKHFRWANTKKIYIRVFSKEQGLFVNDFKMIYYNPWFKGFDYPLLFWTLILLLLFLIIILLLLFIRLYNNKKFTKRYFPKKAELSKLIKK